MQIAVLSSPKAWHFLDLKRAAGTAHDVFNIPFEELEASVGSFSGANWNCSDSSQPSMLNPDCVIVRTMPAGSLQQIIFRMDLLGRLAATGTRVLNSPRSIEIAVDKYLSLALLEATGIRVPKTCVSQSVGTALSHFQALGSDVVVKPLFGSMGNGIVRVQDEGDAKTLFEKKTQLEEVIYQQEFIDHGGFDIRILVIGNTTLAMKRTNQGHWITNVSQGGFGERYDASEIERQLAIRSARAVGAFFAGVDLVYHPDSVEPVVIEVNAVPGWRAICDVLKIDVAQLVISEIESLSDEDQAYSRSSSSLA